ncbi:hypothetical protein [Paenibacillus sp. NPDC057967]|uniref:hypothetical protein n=1 Tax=Paenibacillus sp. NPDC057967 TaxID=3346293 RepID=UPI0036DEB424
MLGLLGKGPDSRRLMAQKDHLYGYELRNAIERGNLELLPRTTGAEGRRVKVEVGRIVEPDTIDWISIRLQLDQHTQGV